MAEKNRFLPGEDRAEQAWGAYRRLEKPGREDFKRLMAELGEAFHRLEAADNRSPEALEALIRLHEITIQAKFYEMDGKVEKTRSLSPKAKKAHRKRIAACRRELGRGEKKGVLHRILGKF